MEQLSKRFRKAYLGVTTIEATLKVGFPKKVRSIVHDERDGQLTRLDYLDIRRYLEQLRCFQN
jgi:hypothetical protein